MTNKKEKNYNYIYRIWNMINMHVYVGLHSTNNLKDGYFGSGGSWKHLVGLQPEIKKYGRSNFVMEILYFCSDSYELDLMERFEIAYTRRVYGNWFKDKKNGLCINIADGGRKSRNSSEAASLAARTRKENGYYESEAHRLQVEKFMNTMLELYGSLTAQMNTPEARARKGKSMRRYRLLHPDETKRLSDLGNSPEARRKAIETKRAHGYLENMAFHSRESEIKGGRTLSERLKVDKELQERWSQRATLANLNRHKSGYYESEGHKQVISKLLDPEAQKRAHERYAYLKSDGQVILMDRGNASKHKNEGWVMLGSKSNYMRKFYVSAGWFSPAQEQCRLDIIEVGKKNALEMFSPKDEVQVAPDASSEERKAAFKADVDAISDCDFMIASTEGKDIGVSVEIGIAYERKKPVILYFPHPDMLVNLMLAELCVAVCYNKEDLDKAIKFYAARNWDFTEKIPYTGNIE